MPGFAGHNVAQRQQRRGHLSMAERRGKSEAEILQVRLTDEEAETFIDRYLDEIYANTPHKGLRRAA
jgi:hypothetical protein